MFAELIVQGITDLVLTSATPLAGFEVSTDGRFSGVHRGLSGSDLGKQCIVFFCNQTGHFIHLLLCAGSTLSLELRLSALYDFDNVNFVHTFQCLF
jgi:hypothetical protein